MAIKVTIETESNYVLINSRKIQRGLIIPEKGVDTISFSIAGPFPSVTCKYDELEINGATFSTMDAAWGAVDNTFFKSTSGGGSGGVQSIVAGGGIIVDDTDPENPIITATGGGGGGGDAVWGSVSGTLSNQTDLKNALDAKADLEDLSDVALSGSYTDLDNIPTTFTPSAHTHTASQISDSTATGRSVLTAASQAAARTAIGAGTSNLAIGTSGSTAMAGNTPVVRSQQEGGVGTVITNHIAMTQAQYDGLAVKNPTTVYEITT